MKKEEMPVFPGLSAEEIKRINALFEGYLFYQTIKDGGREFWTTCCGKHFRIEELRRVEEPWENNCLGAKHNEKIRCPKCGRPLTVKNVKKSRGRKNLCEWHKMALLHVDEVGNVLIQAAWVMKDYREDLQPEVEYSSKALYYFAPGEAKGWMLEWAGGAKGYDWKRMKNIREPFQADIYAAYSTKPQGYQVIGMERLKRSFLRYCGYEIYEKRKPGGFSDRWYHDALLRYLAAATHRPQLEMLVKMGMWDAVQDIVIRRRTGAGVDWSQKDPRKAFGLTSEELKYFKEKRGDLALLRLYHRMKKQEKGVTIQEAAVVLELQKWDGGGHEDLLTWTKKIGTSAREAIKYLGKQENGEIRAWGLWKDYLEAAEFLKYDITVHNVAFPKNLQKAHDEANENRIAVETREQEVKMEKRTQKLEEKYGFRFAGYLIRAPKSMHEIIAEGKALSHCVGGYAARHAEGKVTILFLRSEKKPKKPLATIEMSGSRLIQVHGFRNEMTACPENPTRLPARQLYGAILDPWLEWVKAGSKRNKDGTPKLPKKIKNKEVNVA